MLKTLSYQFLGRSGPGFEPTISQSRSKHDPLNDLQTLCLPPPDLLGHDLDDEADPDPQHAVEQLRLGLDEHGQVDEQLLNDVKLELAFESVHVIDMLISVLVKRASSKQGKHAPCTLAL